MPDDSLLVLLQYGCHRQRKFTHSSFEAEEFAMLEGVRTAKELAAIHALVSFGNKYRQAPVDVYTDNVCLYNKLDAVGVVQPKEVGAAVQKLRELYHGGTMSTVTRLGAHDLLADALTQPGRNTALQHTIRTWALAVRLAAIDYRTKRSSAAPDQDGVIEHKNDYDAITATSETDYADDDDIANTDNDTCGTGMGKYE